MQERGIEPDVITYYAAISACDRVGVLSAYAMEFFQSTHKDARDILLELGHDFAPEPEPLNLSGQETIVRLPSFALTAEFLREAGVVVASKGWPIATHSSLPDVSTYNKAVSAQQQPKQALELLLRMSQPFTSQFSDDLCCCTCGRLRVAT